LPFLPTLPQKGGDAKTQRTQRFRSGRLGVTIATTGGKYEKIFALTCLFFRNQQLFFSHRTSQNKHGRINTYEEERKKKKLAHVGK
jgi:hypothetical protein